MGHKNPGKNQKSAVIGDSVEESLPLFLRPPNKTIPNAYSQGRSAPGEGRYRILSTQGKIL